MEEKRLDVTMESGSIVALSRAQTDRGRLFAELIDNSIQSYLDHEDILKRLPNGDKCRVNITWTENEIVVADNAFGMELEDFQRAVKFNSANPNADRINQLGIYGIGLKFAAVNLGNICSITTTAFNSTKRYTTSINYNYLRENNPRTIPYEESDDYEDSHETTITIKELRKDVIPTSSKIDKIRTQLGVIFQYYINGGVLSLIINGIPVKYDRPELRKDEFGIPYFKRFTGSFVTGGNEYKYSGDIAILNKGDQAITGLNLIQAKRCISINYKPEILFGKGNSFQQSRIIGTVVFEGNNYLLNFNKDGIVWADMGQDSEESFLKSLNEISEIKEIIKLSKKLSFKDDTDKNSRNTDRILDGIKTITKVVEETKDEPSSGDEPEEPISGNQEESEDKKYYSLDVAGKPVKIFIKYNKEGIPSENWIKLDKEKDDYVITINLQNKYYVERINNSHAKGLSNSLLIILVTTMIKCQNLGIKLSDSKTILEEFNKCLNKEASND